MKILNKQIEMFYTKKEVEGTWLEVNKMIMEGEGYKFKESYPHVLKGIEGVVCVYIEDNPRCI